MKKVLLLLVVLLGACSSESGGLTTDDVVQSFKDAGLEVEDVRDMTKDDYGMAPMTATDGVRFLVPSLGENAGGRIMVFDNEDDLDQTKAYYDELGESSAMLFSWTIKHENALIQINGDLPESKYEEYKKALQE